MALISTVNFLALADHIAAAWDLLTPLGSKSASLTAGTVRNFIQEAFLIVVEDVDDYEQQSDMAQSLNQATLSANKEAAANAYGNQAITALESHVGVRGRSVASSIQSLATFLSYYNGGAGGARFANMVTPSFSDAYFSLRAQRLPAAGVLSPAIYPGNGQASGMGTRAVGGAFTDGAAVDNTLYSEVNLVAVLTVDFAGGSAAPTLTVNGTDHTGVAMTWTGTFGSNNPVAAVSTTTTEAITAWTRQVVTLASGSGIVPGSWLTLEAGTNNEEKVLVEAVSGADITAVFKKAHLTAAAVTGNLTLTLAPGTAGRRCRDVTGITIGITAHSAGTVRIEGVQDRMAL